MNHELDRITTSPNVSGGKPSIRQMRFTVAPMLELLASGMTHSEILADYPFLERKTLNRFSNMPQGLPMAK
jgi:uncharacterized protein (DUF433 family)